MRRKKLPTKPVIEHPLLQPFEPQLKKFLEFAFDGGIRSLEAAGYKLGDDLVNDDGREYFRNGLFSAFAQTQSAVGILFIELEKKRREVSEQVKRLRMDRNPAQQDTQTQLQAIQNRQIILRRLIDGMLWVLLPEAWIANHLAFQSHVGQPDPDELMKVLSIAWELNQGAKREIHLVSDLATIVQVGDIIRIRWDENGVYLRFQEIKHGPMNDKLSDFIDSRGGTLSEADLEEVETKLGPDARTQALRMIHQRERFQQLVPILQPESRPIKEELLSIRQAHGDEIALLDDELLEALTRAKPPSMTMYLPLLPELVADAKARGISVLEIDGCLCLVAL